MPVSKIVGRALLMAIAAMPLFVVAQNDEGPILMPKKRITPPPAATATLLVMCDLACNWSLDGEQKDRIGQSQGRSGAACGDRRNRGRA